MPRFEVGDKVRKNGVYADYRSAIGKEFIVTATGFMGDVEVIWTEPSLNGAYAADGFDLVEAHNNVCSSD